MAIVVFLIFVAFLLLFIGRDERNSKTKFIVATVAQIYELGKAAKMKSIEFNNDDSGKPVIKLINTEITNSFSSENIFKYRNNNGELLDAFGNKLYGQEVNGKIEIKSPGKDGIIDTPDDIGTVRHLTSR